MAYEFRLQRRVEFAETDAAGIVHFSNFFRYMEAVEHAFFRSLGHSVMWAHHQPPLGFPRVAAACEYKAPLRFEDVVELHLLVREIKPKSLSYQVRFLKLSTRPPQEVACGSLTVVCVAKNADGSFQAVDLPRELVAQLEVAPAELLG